MTDITVLRARGDAGARRAAGRPLCDESGAIEFSEDALALQFVREHGKEFRWTPGMDWMKHRGTHWERDTQLERYDAARRLCRSAASVAGDPREAKRLASSKTVNAVVGMSQSDPAIALPAAAWDADPWILNTPEGVVDLRTGKTRPRRGDYVTQLANASPSSMPCPVWDRFISDVFCSDLQMVEFMQRLLGYLLTADRSEQKLFFFFGLGANGKSTLIDLVAWIAGTYSLKLPATVLMQTHAERHPTELAQLRGKRLAVSSELDEGQFWAESRIKELTGDEVLTARYMRQDFFEFTMTQTHVIVGNYKPRLRGGDAALARRFVLVPFNAKFEGAARDPSMLPKLRAEAPGILAWMVAGAVKWNADGLAIPSSVQAASREYLADNDDVSLWLAECCAMQSDVRALAIDLYESFATWIKARGQHVPSMRLFSYRVSVLPGISKVRSDGIYYCGIALTYDEKIRQADERRGAY